MCEDYPCCGHDMGACGTVELKPKETNLLDVADRLGTSVDVVRIALLSDDEFRPFFTLVDSATITSVFDTVFVTRVVMHTLQRIGETN